MCLLGKGRMCFSWETFILINPENTSIEAVKKKMGIFTILSQCNLTALSLCCISHNCLSSHNFAYLCHHSSSVISGKHKSSEHRFQDIFAVSPPKSRVFHWAGLQKECPEGEEEEHVPTFSTVTYGVPSGPYLLPLTSTCFSHWMWGWASL